MISLIQWRKLGGKGSFLLSNINLLASSVQKANILQLQLLKRMFCALTPNIAIKADGSIGKPIISENASKINFQTLYKLVHVQNMCKRLAGACLHLSQIITFISNIYITHFCTCLVVTKLKHLFALNKQVKNIHGITF